MQAGPNQCCGVYISHGPCSMPDSPHLLFRLVMSARLAWHKNRELRVSSEVSHTKCLMKGWRMRKLVWAFLLIAAVAMAGEKSVYDFALNSIEGEPTSLAKFRGKVVLLVNVASRCGFTPQYSALQNVYETYQDRNFVIVGIPANNFGGQEPGSNQEIKTFCSTKYNVTFPMMAKVSVKGADKTPLYQFLTDKSAYPQTGGEIQWNFTKFLVGPDGRPVARFEPQVTPDDPQVISAIEKELATLKN